MVRYYNVPENLKKKPTKIIYANKKIGSGKYYGSHYYVKNLPGMDNPPLKKNEIMIYGKQNPFRIEEDTRHELTEKSLMEAGWKYKLAHEASNILQGQRDLIVSVKGDKNKRGTVRRRTQSMI